MRKSKYLGMTSGEWTCTHVGVASVQPAYTKKRDLSGKRLRSRYPGHQNYYYIFERATHDGKADKMVRLSARQVKCVADGWITVEGVATAKNEMKEAGTPASRFFVNKVSYSFKPGC